MACSCGWPFPIPPATPGVTSPITFPPPSHRAGAQVRVFLGELAGTRSPVHTFTPLLGAQIDLRPGTTVTFDVDRTFEHGVLLDQGSVQAEATTLEVADLWYQAPGHDSVVWPTAAKAGAGSLLGGPPFGEQLIMWWNFVGRTHDEIVRYRQMWQDEDVRFGAVPGIRGPGCPHLRFRTSSCDHADDRTSD